MDARSMASLACGAYLSFGDFLLCADPPREYVGSPNIVAHECFDLRLL